MAEHFVSFFSFQKRIMIVPLAQTPQDNWDSGHLTAKRRSIHEDEWLDQTRGLSIHSPALSIADDVDCFEDDLANREAQLAYNDVQMVRIYL